MISSIKPFIGSSSLHMFAAKRIWEHLKIYILVLEKFLEFMRHVKNILDLRRAFLASLNIIVSILLYVRTEICINLSCDFEGYGKIAERH